MPVKQSASKEEFLVAIGLNQQDSDDRRKFCDMWVCYVLSLGEVLEYPD